jgi:hypothetical protein
MRVLSSLLFALLALACSTPLHAASLATLKVLYLGDPDTPRSRDYISFLQPKVAKVQALSRSKFNPSQAADFDVVLLDWPQTGTTQQEWKQPSPLGPRDQWKKPVVLLGSAGLNLAVVWKVRGGSG